MCNSWGLVSPLSYTPCYFLWLDLPKVFKCLGTLCKSVQIWGGMLIFLLVSHGVLSHSPPLLYPDRVECRTSPTNKSTLCPFIELLSVFRATQLCYIVLRSENQIQISGYWRWGIPSVFSADFWSLMPRTERSCRPFPISECWRLWSLQNALVCFSQDILLFLYITLTPRTFAWMITF